MPAATPAQRLAAIASQFAGRPITVTPQPGRSGNADLSTMNGFWLGSPYVRALGRLTPQRWSRIQYNAPVLGTNEEALYVFAHELGHLMRGKGTDFSTPNASGGVDVNHPKSNTEHIANVWAFNNMYAIARAFGFPKAAAHNLAKSAITMGKSVLLTEGAPPA